MKLVLLSAAGALILAAGCASTPREVPVQQRLLGAWSCTTAQPDMQIKSKITYLEGGKADIEANVTAPGFGPAPVDVAGTGQGAWSVGDDGRLNAELLSLEVKSAKMGDQVIPPAMVQSRIDLLVVGQKTASTLNFTEAGVELTDESGLKTTCTR
jgi:hypothetical protein